MRLPEATSPDETIVEYMNALEDECIRDPNRRAWDASKQRWMDLYTGNHFADPLVSAAISAGDLEPEQLSATSDRRVSSIVRMVYNRVMNAILAMLAGQVSNPPKVMFGARENGDPPIYYFNGNVQSPVLQQIAMQAGAADPQAQAMMQVYGPDHPEAQGAAMQAGQSVPLPPELADQVKAMIDQGKMMTLQARMAGMPPPQGIIPPEALVEITDQTTAQFTQTVFDALWEQSGGIEATSENILNKKVLGWQPTLVETDRSKIEYGDCPITLTNVEGSQVYYDPMTSSFRKPRYAMMREPVSLEEGIAKYPDIADVLKSKAMEGNLLSRVRYGARNGRLFNLQYSRDMCVIRTLWIMDCPFPMDPDEALACGKVSVQNVPTGNIQQIPDEATGTIIQKPETRQTMVSGETGEQDITPGHPSWPIIYGIREIRDIEGVKVFDQRCKLPTIPLPNNINIPIPFSPYGFGEPDRLDGLQMAINRVLSDLVANHRYRTYPPEVAHESVGGLQNEVRTMRTQPNSVTLVPATIAQQLGGDLSKLIQYVETPEIGNDAWQLLQFLVEAIDKEANNTDVQQGSAPSGTSGEWVANLQAAANQVAQVTSKSTEAWLKEIVRLYVHFITHDMTTEDVMKYSSKYPPAIIDAFHRRQKALYLDITVEVQSGSAAAKQGQTQNMIAARAQGITVSEPSIMSRLDLDPDAELKAQSDWLNKMRESGLIDQMAEKNSQGGQSEANNDSKQVNGPAAA